ncbi:hypothetical protein Y032_0177g615 [Ancylostoma ceylanicum]|uniref:SCP domain-containing protein n=1 Tax=Ancylostoma ceylanicum TaxID=53326 RepID=A0A016STX7_9BILA|nr:hypothetical protein Y032_0177g615 [Ancylostoma ceylanicum]
MAKLYFIALAAASLLPILCEGKPDLLLLPQCPNGLLDQSTINNGILGVVNTRREMLARGMQTNGKQFDLLPAATNMTQLAWSCQLELEAIKALENVCNTANPSRPNSGGKASIYVENTVVFEKIDKLRVRFHSVADEESRRDLLDSLTWSILSPLFSTRSRNGSAATESVYLFEKECTYTCTKFQGVVSAEIFFAQNLREILSKVDTFVGFQFTRSGSVKINPIYRAEKGIKDYANLVRATNTEIGCALTGCLATPTNQNIIYCILNGMSIKKGDAIYQGTERNTEGCKEVTCPREFRCNPNTLLCYNTTATSTSTPTTISTTTITSTTSTTTTTTKPASSQAQFPTGASSRCSHPYAKKMTDALRTSYEDKHNFRR